MKNKLINYELVEKPIDEIEKILAEFDQEESDLIMRFIVQRRAKKKLDFVNKEQANSIISTLPGPIRKLMFRDKNDEEDN